MAFPRVVAVTGLHSFSGARSAERLLRWSPTPAVVGLDRTLPRAFEGRIDFHEIDLTDPAADIRLAEIFEKTRCEAVLHAAFRRGPYVQRELQRELEVQGSAALIGAVSAARVRKLVVTSHAEVYGAHPDSPALLTESQPLWPHPGAHQTGGSAPGRAAADAFDELIESVAALRGELARRFAPERPRSAGAGGEAAGRGLVAPWVGPTHPGTHPQPLTLA